MCDGEPDVNRRRSEIRRLPDRADYDRDHINRILDEALICHVGFTDAEGLPVVIPTIHARIADTLYLHGSPASRMLRTIGTGQTVSVSAALVDGIVLAKSHMHHSLNYRSVVLFGRARAVSDPDEKAAAFETIVEHLVRGRWSEARQPDDRETRATAVVAVDIEEASAKVRTGPPKDDDEDLELPYWTGVIPLHLTAGDPVPNSSGPVPEHVRSWRR